MNLDYADFPGPFRVGMPETNCPDRHQYHGDVDEVRVYKRALGADEIAYLSAGFHRTPPTLPIPAGPKNTRRPGVYGIPSPGNVLACDPGDWDPATATRQYLWERAPRSVTVEGDDAWAAIDGADQQGYTVQAADLGLRSAAARSPPRTACRRRR